jgi:hypothetical protein
MNAPIAGLIMTERQYRHLQYATRPTRSDDVPEFLWSTVVYYPIGVPLALQMPNCRMQVRRYQVDGFNALNGPWSEICMQSTVETALSRAWCWFPRKHIHSGTRFIWFIDRVACFTGLGSDTKFTYFYGLNALGILGIPSPKMMRGTRNAFFPRIIAIHIDSKNL